MISNRINKPIDEYDLRGARVQHADPAIGGVLGMGEVLSQSRGPRFTVQWQCGRTWPNIEKQTFKFVDFPHLNENQI
jgi:hypothetical protein